MINIRVVEPAVHESGKVIELLRLQHGRGQHRLVGDPLLRPHLRGEMLRNEAIESSINRLKSYQRKEEAQK